MSYFTSTRMGIVLGFFCLFVLREGTYWHRGGEIAGGNVIQAAAMENYLMVPQNLNMDSRHDSAISLLGIHSKDLKTGTPTNTCTHMCIAAMNRAQQLTHGNNTNVRQLVNR